MKKIVSIAHLTVLATLGGLAGTVAVSAAVNAATDSGGKELTAQIRDVKGEVIGNLTVAPADKNQERLTVRAWGLAPGFHGFHVHTVGKCDPNAVDPSTGKVSPFFTAGGHLNLDATHTHPSHSGDLPGLLAAQDGRGVGETVTDRFQANNLLDADGSAIIVHLLPDNEANIPERSTADGKKGPDAATLATGDSGGRFACGVIGSPKKKSRADLTGSRSPGTACKASGGDGCDQLMPSVGAGLTEDRLKVLVDCVDRQIEPASDLLGRRAVLQTGQDLPFASGDLIPVTKRREQLRARRTLDHDRDIPVRAERLRLDRRPPAISRRRHTHPRVARPRIPAVLARLERQSGSRRFQEPIRYRLLRDHRRQPPLSLRRPRLDPAIGSDDEQARRQPPRRGQNGPREHITAHGSNQRRSRLGDSMPVTRIERANTGRPGQAE